MISQIESNLAPWAVQVVVMGSLAALLPLIFRLRHPRTLLAYTHLALVVCLVLPLIQPWHSTTTFPEADATIGGIGLPWQWIVLAVLVAGFVLRLAWLASGMLWIRRCRRASTLLNALPHSLRLASLRVRACALFYVSREVRSPATVGLFRPVVLLPESFLTLNASWQHGIACHELLHVRRKDWLVTVIEEVVAAVFWFHPGVWWLLSRSRLAREQLVDAAVVRITSARKDYIESLLALAGTRLESVLSPATPFLRNSGGS